MKINNFYSRSYKDLKKRTIENPQYKPPEVYKGIVTEHCDVWAVGVILYIALCGKFPFSGSSREQILKNILKGNIDELNIEWQNTTFEAQNFIKNLLKCDLK